MGVQERRSLAVTNYLLGGDVEVTFSRAKGSSTIVIAMSGAAKAVRIYSKGERDRLIRFLGGTP